MKSFRYRIFGVTIESELELPGLVVDHQNNADVTISYGNVPKSFTRTKSESLGFESNGVDFLYKSSTLGRIRVRNGKQIFVDPIKGTSNEIIRRFLFGTVFSGLFLQRGLIPIHGSAVLKNGKSVIFSGKSSSGKSSLACALSEKQFSIFTDDLAVIEIQDKRKLVLYKGMPFIRLCHDVVDHLDLNTDNLRSINSGLLKYDKTIKNEKLDETAEFQKIIIINKGNVRDFSYEEIFGIEKYNRLIEHTFNVHYLNDESLVRVSFERLSRLAVICKLYIVNRPETPLRIRDFAQFVDENIIEG